MRAPPVVRLALIAVAVSALGGCSPPVALPTATPAPIRVAPLGAPPVPREAVPTVLARIAIGTEITPDAFTLSSATRRLYVGADADTVVVIDVDARRVVDSVEVDGGTGALVAHDGAGEVYGTASVEGSGTVTVLEGAEVVDRIALNGTTSARSMAVDPSTDRLFVSVTRRTGDGEDQGVAVIDTTTRELLRLLPAGPFPVGVAVDPDQGAAFVSDSEAITVIDTASLQIRGRFSVGTSPGFAGPGPLAVDVPDGLLFALHEAFGSLTVLDSGTGEIIRTIECGGPGPFDLASDASARRAYITGCADAAVAVVDLDTLAVIETLRPARAGGADATALGYAVEVDPETHEVFLIADGIVSVIEGR